MLSSCASQTISLRSPLPLPGCKCPHPTTPPPDLPPARVAAMHIPRFPPSGLSPTSPLSQWKAAYSIPLGQMTAGGRSGTESSDGRVPTVGLVGPLQPTPTATSQATWTGPSRSPSGNPCFMVTSQPPRLINGCYGRASATSPTMPVDLACFPADLQNWADALATRRMTQPAPAATTASPRSRVYLAAPATRCRRLRTASAARSLLPGQRSQSR